MLYGRLRGVILKKDSGVLILIFLENALRQTITLFIPEENIEVLILIFLENALRHIKRLKRYEYTSSLNPYFFGKCSTAMTYPDIKCSMLRS